jgi:tRNA-guanine family transglycosylase
MQKENKDIEIRESPALAGLSRAPYGEDISSIAELNNLSNVVRDKKFAFEIEKRSSEAKLARAGKIITPHGEMLTPCFTPVGTKATVKGVKIDAMQRIGATSILANTYHLYLQPGEEIVEKSGGFGKFMNWTGPTWTDSGGFQVFSLGAAYGTGVSKIRTKSDSAKRYI